MFQRKLEQPLFTGNGTSQIIEPTTGIQVERHLDGSFVRFDPDGRIVKGYTDGTEVIIEPDSTLIRRNADGSVSSVTLSNGTEVEWPPVEMNITTTNHRENPHSQVNENLTVSLDQNQTPVQSQQGQLQQQQLLQQQWSPPDIEATTPSGKIDDPIFTDLIASSVFNSQGCTLFFPDKAGLARMQKNNEVWKKLTSSPKFRRCFYMQHLVPNVRLDLINATGIEKRDIVSAQIKNRSTNPILLKQLFFVLKCSFFSILPAE